MSRYRPLISCITLLTFVCGCASKQTWLPANENRNEFAAAIAARAQDETPPPDNELLNSVARPRELTPEEEQRQKTALAIAGRVLLTAVTVPAIILLMLLLHDKKDHDSTKSPEKGNGVKESAKTSVTQAAH